MKWQAQTSSTSLHCLEIKAKVLHMGDKTLLFWPLLSLHHGLISPLPFQFLFPHFPKLCIVAITSTHTHSYFTLLRLHTFIFFPFAFSLCSANELFLKFLLMNHQFCEAFPWTSLKGDFLSTLYNIMILVSLHLHVLLPDGTMTIWRTGTMTLFSWGLFHNLAHSECHYVFVELTWKSENGRLILPLK